MLQLSVSLAALALWVRARMLVVMEVVGVEEVVEVDAYHTND